MKQNVIARVWNFLTAPHPSITDIEMRRQSKLLAGILTVFSLVTLVATVFIVQRNGLSPTVYATWGVVAVVVILFFVNRAGKYRAASYTYIVIQFIVMHSMPYFTGTLVWLLFGAMVMIMSVLLLPGGAALVLFALSMATQIAFVIFAPMQESMTNFASTIVFTVTSPLIFVFIYHRRQLEAERQAELREANTLLTESSAKLSELNDQLEHRVAERTKQLEEARDRAERADQIKSQFLASMSHELRTPLNAILNFTEMMSLEMAGPVNEQQKDMLEKSLGSARHLLSLINDVLDVSKMQSGMLSLFLEDDINLNKEVNAVEVTAISLLKGKPVKLVMDVDANLPPMRGDSRRIRQILLNLISNAAKFTEEGTITLSAKQRNSEILFAVIDTGPGIDQEEQKTIFEPFVQTETGIKHTGGTGLGLSISKHLAEAHGGKLWLESKPGDGASFYVTLPIVSQVPAAA